MASSDDVAASALDTAGVAVITGGASGIGRATAARLVRCGMPVAVLDVSAEELAAAAEELRATAPGGEQQVLSVICDVTSFASCEAAQREIAAAFAGRSVSFLFCNAGIFRPFGILQGGHEDWAALFSVNVFGVVNTIKAFVPGIIAEGPLPSGRKTAVVCTSSVVGLVGHHPGPYSVSKMAATAVAEQLALELDGMGKQASHISPHMLAPSVADTNVFSMRGADGVKSMGDEMKNELTLRGSLTADHIVEGLFRGVADGNFYIVLDHDLDVATTEQVSMRMEDQMSGRRPRKPEPLGIFLQPEDMQRRKEMLAEKRKVSSEAPTGAKSRL